MWPWRAHGDQLSARRIVRKVWILSAVQRVVQQRLNPRSSRPKDARDSLVFGASESTLAQPGGDIAAHEPVLVDAVLAQMAPRPGMTVLDGTVGCGGHAAAIWPRIQPDGRYIGLDVDEEMLRTAHGRLGVAVGQGIELVVANYADFPRVLERCGLQRVDAMLLDLGVNSVQLDDPKRGFSFDREGPLDMRFNKDAKVSAMDLVNALPESELADLLFEMGQENASRKVAKRICQVRHSGRITTTLALARAVESAMPGTGGKIHPATRVFQALRIAVNRELDNLERFLAQVTAHLAPAGRLLVISFHSLEDGIVKKFLRGAEAANELTEITKRPIIAESQERDRNPRSRSAKLRVAVRQG